MRSGRSRECCPITSPLGSLRRKPVTLLVTRTEPNVALTAPASTVEVDPTKENVLADWDQVDHPGSPRTTVAVPDSRSSSVTTCVSP